MISPINNYQQSFTSLVPVRVKIDGMQTRDKKYIQSACRQLAKILAGPAKGNEKNQEIICKFAKFDPDYSIEKGFFGYPKLLGQKNMQPSNYFRSVFANGDRDCFFVTGVHTQTLKNFGKDIGIETRAAKERDMVDSLDLMVAKGNYRTVIRDLISNLQIRLRESFDPTTRIREGELVNLTINMKSNGKYKQPSFKMSLDDIEINA